jgi:Mg/Co/Ni transporter MgtE
MTTEFVTVPPEATVQTALAKVRDATDVESVPYVYVVEPRTERLTGVSSLRDLIEVEPQTPIREVMASDLVTIARRRTRRRPPSSSTATTWPRCPSWTRSAGCWAS